MVVDIYGDVISPEVHGGQQEEGHTSSAFLSRVSTHPLAVVTYAISKIASITLFPTFRFNYVAQRQILHTHRLFPKVFPSHIF
jgi:hypothetical protein